MKTFRTLGIMALAVILLSSCQKEKKFSTHIIHDFYVHISESDTSFIDISAEISALVNAELDKVKNDIKSYELVGITYEVFEYSGPQPLTFEGMLGFGNANATAPGVVHSLDDIDLKAQNDSPARTKLNLNSQDIARINQYFLDTNGLRMFFSGNSSEKPLDCVIQVWVDIDAIAETKKK